MRAEEKKRRGWGDNPIQDPYVIGAYIHLGNCFDLTDMAAVAALPRLHRLTVEACQERGLPVLRPAGRLEPEMTQEERNRQVFERFVREFSALSSDEKFRRLVEAGIYTEEGKLTPRYCWPDEPPPGAEAAK